MHGEAHKKAQRRLKIIEGQIKGLQKMIEDGKYCMDIINQSMAIKQALSGVGHVLLNNHLSTHVIEQMKNGQSQKAVKEILHLHKYIK